MVQDSSSRARSERLKCTVRRRVFNKDPLFQDSWCTCTAARECASVLYNKSGLLVDRPRVGWRNGSLWEEYHESRICSRDTYPESYITKYTTYTKMIDSGVSYHFSIRCILDDIRLWVRLPLPPRGSHPHQIPSRNTYDVSA